MSLRDKRGRLLISGHCYKTDPETVQKALSGIGFLPFRVEHLAMEDTFELLGCANDFESLSEGQVAQDYMLEIKFGNDGKYESASAISK